MIKILHTADLGLKNYAYGGINPETGLNRRFEDVYRTFMFVVNKAIKLEYKQKNTKFVFKKKTKLKFRIRNQGIPNTKATLFVQTRLSDGSIKIMVEKPIKIYRYIGNPWVSCDITPAFLGEHELSIYVWVSADNPVPLCPVLTIPINVIE